MIRRDRVLDRLELPEAAADQDGVFTRAQARREGWSDSRQRRLVRDGLWVPVAGSVLRHRAVEVGPWQRARAVSLSDRVPSHATAAALWGYSVDAELRGIVAHGGGPVRGLREHRIPLAAEDVVSAAGMSITSELRTLTDLLCLLPVQASLPTVTDALRRGLLDVIDLADIATLARSRTGAGRAREVARTCVGRPWSVLEWRYQQLARRVSDRWTFNVELPELRGLVGPLDAVHPASRVVVELDGKRFHVDTFQADRTRDQRLIAAGFVVLRFTWDDIEHRPDEVVTILRRTIAQRVRAVA